MKEKLIKKNVKAVYDDEIESFFLNLGLLDKFKNNELKCKFCKNVITFNNFHSIFPQSGDVKLVCDNIKCVEELYKMLREGDINI